MDFMHIIFVLLGCFAAAHLLWAHYVIVMGLKRVHDAGTMSKAQLVLGLPALVIGLVLDFFVNVIVMTVVLLELPREWTVSARLTRHTPQDRIELAWSAIHGWGTEAMAADPRPKTWRYKICHSLRKTLLDNIDPSGFHKG